jgi:ABC-type sugar transport system permease subunit
LGGDTVAITAPATRQRWWPLTYHRRLAVEGWLLVLPVVLGTLIFDILPTVPAVYWSFTYWDGVTSPEWRGLENYAAMWAYGDFLSSLRATFVFTFLQVPLALVTGLALALLVNRPLRGIAFIRALYYLPVVSSIVAVAIVWKFMFSYRFGVLNHLLSLVGISGPNWLGDAFWAMIVLIVVSVWMAMGYNMVLFLAGLQGIPHELYEAAEIDGANPWQRLRDITLPLLTPTIFFILIIGFINSFQAFALVWVMTGGGPGTATELYIFFLYEEAFRRYQWGLGSALAVVGFAIIGVVTLIQWRLQKRWVHYG